MTKKVIDCVVQNFIILELLLLTSMNEDMKYYATVVILTKNPGNIFYKVLESALQQKTSFDYEILVIDSGSSDGTVEYIKKFDRVRLIEIKPSDFGHGKTRNLAIKEANGQYVAMLTHDAQPYNNQWLQNLVSVFKKDPKIAGAFGRHKAYNNAVITIKQSIKKHFDLLASACSVSFIEDLNRYKNDIGYKQQLYFFSDNNSCINKKIWKKIPIPDVAFAEDQAWAKAFLEQGYKKAYVDNAIVYHSHNYGILNTFRRSYDESKSLRKIFGYALRGKLVMVFIQAAKFSIMDIICIIKSDQARKLFEIFRSPFLNLAKQFGFYCGYHHKFFDKIFQKSPGKR